MRGTRLRTCTLVCALVHAKKTSGAASARVKVKRSKFLPPFSREWLPLLRARTSSSQDVRVLLMRASLYTTTRVRLGLL